jgi:hypothetical protein
MHPTYATYTGSSMNPVFKPGDVLQVLPYNGKTVECGDVILFSCTEEKHMVVHRVVDVDEHGIRTKGDNNRHLDPWAVAPEWIVGYVVRAQRRMRWRSISGGCLGRFVANRVRAVNCVGATLSALFHTLCRWATGDSSLRLQSRLQSLNGRLVLSTNTMNGRRISQ